jgi:hypothetical protein
MAWDKKQRTVCDDCGRPHHRCECPHESDPSPVGRKIVHRQATASGMN